MGTKRLLCYMSSMNIGGAETFLMKQYRQLDREKYQLDFCVNVRDKCAYDDEIEALGGRIYRIPSKSDSFSASVKAFQKIVSDNGYKAVLCSSTKPGVALDLLAAKAAGAKRIIHRSSSSSNGSSLKIRAVNATIGQLAKIIPSVKLAPSVLAAEFIFGKGCIEKGRAHILNNGVDTSLFSYSDEKRSAARKALGLDDEFTLIHIGRFLQVKNHSFLLDTFAKVVESHRNSKLILAGTGELEDEMKLKAKSLGLEDKVIFLGARKDIPDLLSAADVLVFPSFFEGMPNVVIEAQAMSLKCIVSDRITSECRITPLVNQLPLGDTGLWTQEILACKNGYKRKDMSAEFRRLRYDAQSTVEDFVKYCFDE